MSWNPTNWIATLLVAASSQAGEPDVSKPAVVIVHGIFDSGAKMSWLAHQFAKSGYETFAPSLTPSNGSRSLVNLSAQLEQRIRERFPRERRIHLVGFSMGGLITRHWLQNHADLSRVCSYVTLSAPHRGTILACTLGIEGVREMRPGSPFLRQMEAEDERLRALEPLSLYTPFDLIIVPANSSRWSLATTEKVWLPLHPLMVFSPSVAARLKKHFGLREGAALAKTKQIARTGNP